MFGKNIEMLGEYDQVDILNRSNTVSMTVWIREQLTGENTLHNRASNRIWNMLLNRGLVLGLIEDNSLEDYFNMSWWYQYTD